MLSTFLLALQFGLTVIHAIHLPQNEVKHFQTRNRPGLLLERANEGTYPVGAACTAASQCSTKRYEANNGEIFDAPTFCQPSHGGGGPCHSGSECFSGKCNTATATCLRNSHGGKCVENLDCQSNYCQYDFGTRTGMCLKDTDEQCRTNQECASEICYRNKCWPLPQGNRCVQASNCVCDLSNPNEEHCVRGGCYRVGRCECAGNDHHDLLEPCLHLDNGQPHLELDAIHPFNKVDNYDQAVYNIFVPVHHHVPEALTIWREVRFEWTVQQRQLSQEASKRRIHQIADGHLRKEEGPWRAVLSKWRLYQRTMQVE
ncbi:hypothetical protein V8E36_007746 [Tilletia maclaganii]